MACTFLRQFPGHRQRSKNGTGKTKNDTHKFRPERLPMLHSVPFNSLRPARKKLFKTDT